MPHGFSSNVALGGWVLRQRQQFAKGNLAIEKLERLKNLDFDFNPTARHRDKMINTLIKFFNIHGHSNVPNRKGSNDEYDYQELAYWVSNIRLSYRKGRLEDVVLDRLNKINFVWNPIKGWDYFYEALMKFYSENGHFQVPKDYYLLPSLSAWLVKQRQDNKNNKLTKKRFILLNRLGVDLSP